MFTIFSKLAVGLLARNGFTLAFKVLPYLLPAVPMLVAVIAAIVGYSHDDTVGRWSLACVAAGELVVALQLAGKLPGHVAFR